MNNGSDAILVTATTGECPTLIAEEEIEILSTVKNADAIMVLENGRIIERGTHDDLLALQGRYYELHTGKKELD
mgnify:CR=1 FL=1